MADNLLASEIIPANTPNPVTPNPVTPNIPDPVTPNIPDPVTPNTLNTEPL